MRLILLVFVTQSVGLALASNRRLGGSISNHNPSQPYQLQAPGTQRMTDDEKMAIGLNSAAAAVGLYGGVKAGRALAKCVDKDCNGASKECGKACLALTTSGCLAIGGHFANKNRKRKH